MEVALEQRRAVAEKKDSELVEVEVDVLVDGDRSGWPASEWLQIFRSPDRDFPFDLEEPRFEEGKLRFEVTKDDVPRMWKAVTARVEETNRLYAEEVEGPRAAKRRREEQEQSEIDQHLADVQDQLDKLG